MFAMHHKCLYCTTYTDTEKTTVFSQTVWKCQFKLWLA